MRVRIEQALTEARYHRVLDKAGRHVGNLTFERGSDNSGRPLVHGKLDDLLRGVSIDLSRYAYYADAKRAVRDHFDPEPV